MSTTRTRIPPEIHTLLDAISERLNITVPSVIKIMALKHGPTLRPEDIDVYLPPDKNGFVSHRGRYGNGRRKKKGASTRSEERTN